MSTPESKPPVLVARGITKRFGGVKALNGVDLVVHPGSVHCLIGENGCGKSTLIKIISGVEQADEGEIVLDGTRYEHMTPRESLTGGVQVIYQDFSLFPNLTVAENIGLSAMVVNRRKLVSAAESRALATEVVERMGIHLDLDARVGDLNVADRQLTAICRALVQDAKIIFMDEPTTALTVHEVRSLFRVVENLRRHGVAMVFVSHKLDEVLQISEEITVLRNGDLVVTGPVRDFDYTSMVRAMTGREVLVDRRTPQVADDAEVVLAVDGLGSKGAFTDASFRLRKGEILGITGLLGSGRSEITDAIFGVTPIDGGTITVDGRPVDIRKVTDAVAAGIGYVPGDRLSQGLFLEHSIADNVVAGSLDLHRGRGGFIDRPRLKETITRLFTELRIKAPTVQAPARSLSGGNQQRVVLAKWLARSPKVLMLNGPTVGVDIGSKDEIHTILRDEAARGIGVIVVSDDVPELISMCNRVLVFREGRIAVELVGDEVTEANIGKELAA